MALVCEECLKSVRGDSCARHPWATLLDPGRDEDRAWLDALRQTRHGKRGDWVSLAVGVVLISGFALGLSQAMADAFYSQASYMAALIGTVFAFAAVIVAMIQLGRGSWGAMRQRRASRRETWSPRVRSAPARSSVEHPLLEDPQDPRPLVEEAHEAPVAIPLAVERQ